MKVSTYVGENPKPSVREESGTGVRAHTHLHWLYLGRWCVGGTHLHCLAHREREREREREALECGMHSKAQIFRTRA